MKSQIKFQNPAFMCVNSDLQIKIQYFAIVKCSGRVFLIKLCLAEQICVFDHLESRITV